MFMKNALVQNKKIIESLYYIAFSIVLYFISLSLEIKYIFTNAFFFENYKYRTADEIQTIISDEHSSDFINFLYAPIFCILLTLCIAIILYVILIILNRYTSFVICLKIGAISQIVYSLNYFITIILKLTGVIKYDIINVNDTSEYQSILNFISLKDLPDWSLYLFEKMNITEIVFVIILISLINKNIKIPWRYAAIIAIFIETFIITIGFIFYIYNLIF